MFAIQCGNFAFAHKLLDRGANANAEMAGGQRKSVLSLCMLFAHSGASDFEEWKRLVSRLLDQGADPNSALSAAVNASKKFVKRADMVQLLLSHGADPDRKIGETENTVRKLAEINRHLYSAEVLGLLNILPTTSTFVAQPGVKDSRAHSVIVEHPSGKFDSVLDAIEKTFELIRSAKFADRTILLSAQGQEGAGEQYRFADVTFRQGRCFFAKPARHVQDVAAALGIEPARVQVSDD